MSVTLLASLRTRAPALVLAIAVLFLALSMWQRAGSHLPMSMIDEHVHLDTHVAVHEHNFPTRGGLMTTDVVEEWACGVGHEGGATLVPCGDPTLGPESLPSGKYTSGYIHYPTYFLAGEAYRWVATQVGGGDDWVSTYRHWSVIVFVSGLLVLALAGWRLGLTRWSLVAATLIPVAGPGIVMYGTMANPQSAMILVGGLIAWTGIRWVRTGKGFWWVAAAAAFASSIALSHTLPLGAVLIAVTIAVVARRFGWVPAGEWAPRLWHAIVLGLIVLVPVLGYNRFINSRATVSSEVLYAFAAFQDWTQVLVGALDELVHLHTPWFYASLLPVNPAAGVPARMGEVLAKGLTDWIHIVVWATVLLAVVLARPSRPGLKASLPAAGSDPESELASGPGSDPGSGPRGTYDPLWLLLVGSLLAFLLFPACMRVANAIQVGIDYPIVSRYGFGFMPLFLWSVLLLRPTWPTGRVLAALAVPAVLGLSLAML